MNAITKYILYDDEKNNMGRGNSTAAVETISPDDIETEGEMLNIHSKIFQPHRFLILGDLWKHKEVSFNELRNALNTSDGNLASHLRSLEELGLIKARKEIVGRKVNTFYTLTDKGNKEFKNLITALGKQVHLFSVDENV